MIVGGRILMQDRRALTIEQGWYRCTCRGLRPESDEAAQRGARKPRERGSLAVGRRRDPGGSESVCRRGRPAAHTELIGAPAVRRAEAPAVNALPGGGICAQDIARISLHVPAASLPSTQGTIQADSRQIASPRQSGETSGCARQRPSPPSTPLQPQPCPLWRAGHMGSEPNASVTLEWPEARDRINPVIALGPGGAYIRALAVEFARSARPGPMTPGQAAVV